MNFRTKVEIHQNKGFIHHQHKMMSIGSCFASNIGAYLDERRFDIRQMQFGIQFNPVSIEQNMRDAMNERIDESLIIERDEHYYHHNFSAQLVSSDREKLHQLIHKIQLDFKNTILETDRLFLTFGTAWVYRLIEQDVVVSNCHKIPQNNFQKELLNLEDLKVLYKELFEDLKKENPNLEIVLTVSPVRHIKNGLHENNLSKSILLLLTDFLVKSFEFVTYFPAYEIVIDDLRDYRFTNADLIHPNTQAIDYVFYQFQEAYFDETTQLISNLAIKQLRYKNHQPLAPSTAQIKLKASKLKEMEREIQRLKSKF